MFSSATRRGMFGTYTEWALFALLIVVLIVAWWIAEFGLPSGWFRQAPPKETMEEIMASFSAPTAAPEALPPKVLSSFTTPSKKTTALPPQKVLNSFTAPAQQ